MPGVEEILVNGHTSQKQRSSEPSNSLPVSPIAVIGLAGRFPGDATNPSGLWKLCCENRSAWSKIPESRFSTHTFYHPNSANAGSFNAKGAHFLKEDVGLFDASFFGIPPVEAKSMDPQQRLLLESTYEALENAGITFEAISGHQTGVFVGASEVDYTLLMHKDVLDIPVYQSTGCSTNMVSNRISYVFNLKGPSLTIDTACSSALTALHIACQSLRSGESTEAIVCGAHIMLSPDTMVGMSMLRLFGDDGRSYTYDARATGYGRGEGVACLVLKPLQAALRDGDNIRAIIRNTGANQDGKTSGITFPSCDAQAELIEAVYNKAGLDPLETDYVEAHGTGTAAGDPVEAEALARSLAFDRPSEKPLIVGSVKSNVGHLEAASGLAAMVKTIMALENDQIPPNYDFQSPNKDIPLDKWKLKVPTKVQPWPNPDIRRASVSNFGFGGTNVHVICEKFVAKHWSLDHPQKELAYVNGISSKKRTTQTNGIHASHEQPLTNDIGPKNNMSISPVGDFRAPRRQLFVLSANDKAALKARATQLSEYLKANDDIELERLAFTLNERRSQMEWREAISAITLSELSDVLACDGGSLMQASGNPKLGFVFTGQGAQWATMGIDLMVYPVFGQTLFDANTVLKGLGAKWSLIDELVKNAETSSVNRPLLSQTMTTAIQIALVNLLATWKILPNAVVGHSSGEIAAAYAAGALTLAECMLIAYKRGVFAETLKDKRPERPGGMLAIGASQAKIRPMIKRLGSAHIVLACVNAPSLVTASGDEKAISKLQSTAEDENLLNRRLKVDVAYHSPHMKDIAAEYLESIDRIRPHSQSQVEFHSSVRGHLLDTGALNAEYWVENMTSPVQFLDGIKSLYNKNDGPDALIEIGPHSTLEAPIRDIMKANPSWSATVRYFPCLVRNKESVETALSLAAALYVLGVNIDLSAVNQTAPRMLMTPISDLPAYPWNHSRRYWHESRISVNHRQKPFPHHDLLGDLVDDYNVNEPRWRNVLRTVDLPWLLDHRVQDSVIFPLTGYLEMALEASMQRAKLWQIPIQSSTEHRLRDIQVSRSMVLSENSPTEVALTLRPRDEGSRNSSKAWQVFIVYSWTEDAGWTEHCRGLLSLTETDKEPNEVSGSFPKDIHKKSHEGSILEHQAICRYILNPKDIYDRFVRSGLQFGSGFQNIVGGQCSKGHSIGIIEIPDTAKGMPDGFERILNIHPRTFDACFQVTALAAGETFLSASDLHVPTFVKEIALKTHISVVAGNHLQVYASQQRPYGEHDSDVYSSFFVVDPDDTSEVLIEVQGLVASALPPQDSTEHTRGNRGLCYRLQWEPCVDLLNEEQITTAFFDTSIDMRPTGQMDRLERAALYYIDRMLKDLSPGDIKASPQHLQKLYTLLQRQLAQSQHEGLPFQMPAWLHATEQERDQFLSEQSISDDCGRLLSAIGENLIPIILGEVEPLSIMLRDNMLERYYRNFDVMNRGAVATNAVVMRLVHQNPRMKILEIGAGTGGGTRHVLRALGRDFDVYDFTDISPSFFESAKAEQKEWADKIRYQKLNIEEDPLIQDFELGSYDLILAASVLHATAKLDRTMGNVRSLLRPGGKAIIGEVTGHFLSTNAIFGCLPGWWLSEEPERQDGPLLNVEGWDKVFRRNGFSGVDGSIDDNPEGPSVASILLTTAVARQVPTYPKASILVCGQQDQHKDLAEAVGERMGSLTEQASISTGSLLHSDLSDQYGIILALDDPFWQDIDEPGLLKIQQSFSAARGILWVSQGGQGPNPEANMVSGFARSLRTENFGLRFITLNLAGQKLVSRPQIVDLIIKTYQHGFGSDNHPRFFDDTEFAEFSGILHVPRVLSDQAKDRYILNETGRPTLEQQKYRQTGRPMKLKVGQVGLLDSIHYVDDKAITSPIRPNEVEIKVAATGMNFKDLMISLGQLPFYHELGLECSGTITATGADVDDFQVGDRVCALALGSYANFVRTPSELVATIPQEMSYAQAASIPVVFSTVHYALSYVARLRKNESVLIHAAAGGVGQAAIMLAKKQEAEIFTTVSSAAKKKLIMETYGIPENHIYSSRNPLFHKAIMAITKQKGVDVVLNSTSGDMLHYSWQCLAPLGRFLELGKRDLVQNSNLEMEKFAESVTFAAVDLGVLLQRQPNTLKRVLSEVIDMHNQALLQPIMPITVFSVSELQQAMRLMQSGKHTGKIVIEASEDSIVQALPAPSPVAVKSSAATYLITGGTGGLGRSITRWLAREGVKNIILASRSGINQPGVKELVDELRAAHVNIYVESCDVADPANVQRLILQCQDIMPPIRGVIHGAMALRDALFEKTSFTDWSLNIKPRVNGAWNLHNALLDTKLDFFVMLASGSGFNGIAGQAAYAASNTFLDSFAAYRRLLGLPASTIDIGIVEDVGYVAENIQRLPEIERASHDRISEAEILALVKAAMTNRTEAGDFQHTITGFKLLPGKELPKWASDPKFVHVLHSVEKASATTGQQKEGIMVQERLKQADTWDAVVHVICEGLCQKLSGLLMMLVEDISPKKPVVAYGLDSLVAVELRNWITGELDANVPLMELMNSPSIESLSEKIAAKSRRVDVSLKPKSEMEEVTNHTN
ncbi:MAG: hypothetical protein Q9167_005871 [Letrouitia subvulpina]